MTWEKDSLSVIFEQLCNIKVAASNLSSLMYLVVEK